MPVVVVELLSVWAGAVIMKLKSAEEWGMFMEWKWSDYSEYTPAREIFQAVCDELGRYYAEKGKSYTRSGRKIKWKGKNLKFEIHFASSHSNTSGRCITLEIIACVWALSADGMERKGILNFPIREEIAPSDQECVIVKQIDGTELKRVPTDPERIAVVYNNYCNVWGINGKMFENIIRYIDGVIEKMELMETRSGIERILETIPVWNVSYFWDNPNNKAYYQSLPSE